MLVYNFLAVWITLIILNVVKVEGGQPKWNKMYSGGAVYSTSTDTWEECGFLCTKDIQRTQPNLMNTKCSFWTWTDPSARNFSNLCQLFMSEGIIEDNGVTISGASGCYSLSTC